MEYEIKYRNSRERERVGQGYRLQSIRLFFFLGLKKKKRFGSVRLSSVLMGG